MLVIGFLSCCIMSVAVFAWQTEKADPCWNLKRQHYGWKITVVVLDIYYGIWVLLLMVQNLPPTSTHSNTDIPPKDYCYILYRYTDIPNRKSDLKPCAMWPYEIYTVAPEKKKKNNFCKADNGAYRFKSSRKPTY